MPIVLDLREIPRISWTGHNAHSVPSFVKVAAGQTLWRLAGLAMNSKNRVKEGLIAGLLRYAKR